MTKCQSSKPMPERVLDGRGLELFSQWEVGRMDAGGVAQLSCAGGLIWLRGGQKAGGWQPGAGQRRRSPPILCLIQPAQWVPTSHGCSRYDHTAPQSMSSPARVITLFPYLSTPATDFFLLTIVADGLSSFPIALTPFRPQAPLNWHSRFAGSSGLPPPRHNGDSSDCRAFSLLPIRG